MEPVQLDLPETTGGQTTNGPCYSFPGGPLPAGWPLGGSSYDCWGQGVANATGSALSGVAQGMSFEFFLGEHD